MSNDDMRLPAWWIFVSMRFVVSANCDTKNFMTGDAKHRNPFTSDIWAFDTLASPQAPPLQPAAARQVGLMISDKQAGAFRLMVKTIEAICNVNKVA